MVTLCGWLQYRRLGAYFFTIRDAYGVTQIIVPKDRLTISNVVDKLHTESVVKVTGTVKKRPPGLSNPKMGTGEIEIEAEQLVVLNPAAFASLPFNIHEFHKVNEELRLQYRYLDIRNREVQETLRLRSDMILNMRNFLCKRHGFVDVETPTLFRKTPGGAREFVVPTHTPGKYYSLPQSPQQFKQLLMVGGIDRYMQVARCYRDEEGKSDRQPEFTQLDIEMSFVTANDIQTLIEELLVHCWPLPTKPSLPFPRIGYQEAMTSYGSDKPDIRFNSKLHDVTSLMQDSSIGPLCEASRRHPESSVQAISFADACDHLSSKDLDSLKLIARGLDPDVWTVFIKIDQGGKWSGGFTDKLGPGVSGELSQCLHLMPDSVLVLTAGAHHRAVEVIGRLRFEMANLLETRGVQVRGENSGKFQFLWVNEFPLFLPSRTNEGMESAHHPFTAPADHDVDLIRTEPLKVKSQHYDLVLNGCEVGGGSIRIHDAELQRYVLEHILKEDPAPLQHLLTALQFGCPPHGGIALGLDRLIAILRSATSIRDVIAFPKSSEGKDLMCGAPAGLSQTDLEYYHLTRTS